MTNMRVLLFVYLIGFCYSDSFFRNLEDFGDSSGISVANVENGANLYLASNDKAFKLARITFSSGGKTTLGNVLLGQFNDDGSLKALPVSSDLKISSTNSKDDTDGLVGYFFISTAEQAKDPNFSVFVVRDEEQVIDMSTKSESSIVFLNLKYNQSAGDPVYKPYYNSRFYGLSQPKTTKFHLYQSLPNNGYKNTTFKETYANRIFSNPLALAPLNLDKQEFFFDNIEPIQFSSRTCWMHIFGGMKFNISGVYVDQVSYTTTSVTTTGLTMYQFHAVDASVTFLVTPNHNRTTGLLTSANLFDNLNITLTDANMGRSIETFPAGYSNNNVLFSTDLAATSMVVKPQSDNTGFWFIQYFGIDGIDLPTTSTAVQTTTIPTTTTTTTVQTTTSSTGIIKYLVALVLSLILVL